MCSAIWTDGVLDYLSLCHGILNHNGHSETYESLFLDITYRLLILDYYWIRNKEFIWNVYNSILGVSCLEIFSRYRFQSNLDMNLINISKLPSQIFKWEIDIFFVRRIGRTIFLMSTGFLPITPVLHVPCHWIILLCTLHLMKNLPIYWRGNLELFKIRAPL